MKLSLSKTSGSKNSPITVDAGWNFGTVGTKTLRVKTGGGMSKDIKVNQGVFPNEVPLSQMLPDFPATTTDTFYYHIGQLYTVQFGHYRKDGTTLVSGSKTNASRTYIMPFLIESTYADKPVKSFSLAFMLEITCNNFANGGTNTLISSTINNEEYTLVVRAGNITVEKGSTTLASYDLLGKGSICIGLSYMQDTTGNVGVQFLGGRGTGDTNFNILHRVRSNTRVSKFSDLSFTQFKFQCRSTHTITNLRLLQSIT